MTKKHKVKFGEYARIKVKVYDDAPTYPITVDVKNKATGDKMILALSIAEADALADALRFAAYDAEASK